VKLARGAPNRSFGMLGRTGDYWNSALMVGCLGPGLVRQADAHTASKHPPLLRERSARGEDLYAPPTHT